MARTLQLQVDFKANGFLRFFRIGREWQSEPDHLCCGMPQLSISEVAREVGLRPSAIRYYEQIGILPPIQRTSGQRRYDTTYLHLLAVIQGARSTGFTLDEIRELFFGFADGSRAPARWRSSRRRLIGSRPCSVCLSGYNIAATATLSMNVAKGCLSDELLMFGRSLHPPNHHQRQ